MIVQEKIRTLSKEKFSQIVEVRRHLHMHPELSFREYNTSKYIASQLELAGISYSTGHAGTGIIALIHGGKGPGPVLLLRADMDALPITEKNEVSYCSVNKGVMHACGHDVHSACAIGAAFILQELRSEFRGTIKIMFQPGEELLPGGASLMIAGGVLEHPRVDRALALHVFPEMEAGKAGFRSGMYMASTDELYLTVNGRGGHAAMPAQYRSPILAASEMLLEIQKRFMTEGAVKKLAGKDIPTVVAFGNFQASGATNVIPQKAELAGTFRTMDEAWREKAHHLLKDVVQEVAAQHQVDAELRIEKGYPFLVNDENFTRICTKAAAEMIGEQNVTELALRMTAEDFSFITQKVPSCFFRLGTGNSSKGIVSGVHTPTFDVDENALLTGMQLMAWLALNGLETTAGG